MTLFGIEPLAIQQFTLPNGMKVLVQEDHDVPNVAMYLFFKVGSRNERPGITGISHFFEHMMFNGAKKYGPKQFDIQLEKAGGRNNAYTSRDVTVYTDWFPRNTLELMFDLEADRIQNLAFDPKIIESERGVVYSERRLSVENSNIGLLDEQLNAAVFTAHPYHWPVVGWGSDIESWTLDDLKTHFRMGYSPNNCVVVVAGDVSTAEVQRLAERYLAPIPAHEPPPKVRTVEPTQIGQRRVEIRKPAQLPVQMISFHAPKSAEPDWRVLQVIGTILAQGQSSRLYRRMVDGEQTAVSVDYGQDYSLDPGQVTFLVQPRSDVAPEKTEKALFEEIAKLGETDTPAGELRKAKNQLLASLYRDMKTISGKANLLGQAEVFLGDYRRVFSADQELERVTAADVRRVVRKYLTPEKQTIATLIPSGEEKAQ